MLKNKFRILIPLMLIAALFLFPTPALAHDGTGEASPFAGALAWGFLTFGALVIIGVAFVLFSGDSGEASAKKFDSLTGFNGYLAKMKLFSRNARLYMVHVVGMDVIHGTWAVIFNLYLLVVGFDITFIGLRILVAYIARALFSIPAGVVSDRIGRKLSFILGDGLGAIMSLIAISTTNETLLLVTAGIGGIFGSLHGVSEPAFMAENSQNFERVHLFSVSSGTRTAAAIIGSALAGLIPFIYSDGDVQTTIAIYRNVSYFGIGGWFASLIPALMLKQVGAAKTEWGKESAVPEKTGFFSGVKHPDRIRKLVGPEVLISFGAGFAIPLMNVFFRQGVGSEEIEIGAIFSAGEAFLVVGSFLAPLVAMRLGKVRSVVWTRLASIPFIVLFAFTAQVGSAVGSILSVASLAYVARIALMNMASPVRSAFAMEILDPGERGTQVGIEMALGSTLMGITGYLGSLMMDAGDFQTPFLLMAAAYLAATLLFNQFFAKQESEMVLAAAD